MMFFLTLLKLMITQSMLKIMEGGYLEIGDLESEIKLSLEKLSQR